MTKQTDAVKADGGPEDIQARADHFTSYLDKVAELTALAEKDPTLAAEGLGDQDLAEYVALIQDVRSRLLAVERDLATALGKRVGKIVGSLADGRQFTLERATDRKEWDHDEWKRDARRALVERTLENLALSREAIVVDPATGLETEQTLAAILQSAILCAQQVHGSTSPKSTELKALGLYASNYCTSTPSGWRFSAIKPAAPKEDTTDA